ncbi:MAG: hypothetical protein AB7S48_14510 [Bacteroidales bacterium]
MTLLRYTLVALICLLITNVTAQTKKEIEETYKDANTYFYFEDYEEAVALYLQIYKHQPDNYNLNYKIGFCYLSIPGNKEKSISYLQKAVLSTTKKYNEESIFETQAPIDAIFYLGNAYFVNNQIDKALAEFKKFKEISSGKDQWNLEYFDHQVNSAKNSIILQKTPVNFLQTNLGEKINDRFANFNPIISGDGKTLAYTTKRKFYQAVFVSNLGSNGEWSTPKNITLDLQVDGNCSTLSLSYDGSELYLFKDDNHDGNIYVSHLRNGKWSPMAKLNKNINSEYYETHACVSADGKSLYFTSNRKGGYGDLDIYVSERTTNDDWGLPKNLGPSINTSFNENTPFITNNGSMLYFSSEGHNNMGGYDIFISQLNSTGEWTTPINLGYPINTTDDNLFYQPIGDGSKGLLAKFDSDGFGDQDICEVELFIPKFMKNIVSSTSLSDRISDGNYKKIVIDTLNTEGIALMDITNSDIALRIDPLKRYKLFFAGKSFDIKEKIQIAEKIQAKPNRTDAEKINVIAVQQDEAFKNDSITSNPVQDRINLLRQFRDTNNLATIQKNKNALDSQESTNTTRTFDTAIDTDNNNLAEILLLLAPVNTQPMLTKILKNEWNFNKSQLNENVIEFAHAFQTFEEKDAITMALAALADKIIKSESRPEKRQLRNIPSSNYNSFTHFYNRLINLASPELSKLLAATLVNNPDTKTIEELIRNFKNNNPEGYKTYLSELMRILAQVTIGDYMNLSNDLKFNLYNSLTQSGDEKTSNWWLYILISFILISALGLYIYSRKNNKQ